MRPLRGFRGVTSRTSAGEWQVHDASRGYQMERPMNTYEIGCGASNTKSSRLRSPSSAQISRRLAASLCVLLIAFVTLAATSAGRQAPIGNTYSAGGNLMLLPGQPGLAPALY